MTPEGLVASGSTVWLTGLPSAGKSTIAREAADRLRDSGRHVEVLDGDEIRHEFSGDLGFDRRSRDLNVRRIGWMAQLLARNGVTVLVAVVAPYSEARRQVRERHENAQVGFAEVFVDAPVDCCAARDLKGLYARQRIGQLTQLTGADDPYEAPVEPELRLRTDTDDVEQSVALLLDYLSRRGWT